MATLCITTNRTTRVSTFYVDRVRVSRTAFNVIRDTATKRDSFIDRWTPTHHHGFSCARGYDHYAFACAQGKAEQSA